jgi:hypothetical protein
VEQTCAVAFARSLGASHSSLDYTSVKSLDDSDESFIALQWLFATFQCGAHTIMGYAPLSQCVWQGNTDVAATPELATCQPICHANCPFCCLPAGTFSRLKMQSMQC